MRRASPHEAPRAVLPGAPTRPARGETPPGRTSIGTPTPRRARYWRRNGRHPRQSHRCRHRSLPRADAEENLFFCLLPWGMPRPAAPKERLRDPPWEEPVRFLVRRIRSLMEESSFDRSLTDPPPEQGLR